MHGGLDRHCKRMLPFSLELTTGNNLSEFRMIKVQDLTKTFGSKVAVNGISFHVERGEVLGFLGPNGAGKSTSMRMITGFIPPSAGEISVAGFNLLENPLQAKSHIGYLPENAPAYADMTVLSFLHFAAELRGLFGSEKRKAVDRAIDTCFLGTVKHQGIDTLSKGYRHRTCFAQSILHDPDILIMDEPTDGLDPNQKHEVRALIRQMGEKKAIVFSTHILEEVEAACTRAIIIDRGQIVANGTPEELKQKSENSGAVLLRVLQTPSSQVKTSLAQLQGVKKVSLLREEGAGSLFRLTPQNKESANQLAQSVFDLVTKEQWKIDELHTEEGRLDEVFRNITFPDSVSASAAART